MTTTMIRWLAAALAGSFMIPSSYPVHAAGWIVQENEQDPFDKTRSTFIALSKSEANMEWLAIRCLDGDISLLVAAGASNASHGEQSELKIVADSLPVRDEKAVVLAATNSETDVQFGDQSTLEYLKGAQKVSVRYSLGGVLSTSSFSGGKSLADLIKKALTACGEIEAEPTEPPAPLHGKDCSAIPLAKRTLDCEP